MGGLTRFTIFTEPFIFAGIMPTESLSDASADVMRETYDVNVVGPLMVSKVKAQIFLSRNQLKVRGE